MLRAPLIAVAVLSAAWFALGIRQASDVSTATSIVSGGAHLSPAEAGRARSLLGAAAVLNPDSNVNLLQAQLDRDQGDFRAARRTLDQVVAREPDNAEAWYGLALSARGSPSTWARAVRNVLRLDPRVS